MAKEKNNNETEMLEIEHRGQRYQIKVSKRMAQEWRDKDPLTVEIILDSILENDD